MMHEYEITLIHRFTPPAEGPLGQDCMAACAEFFRIYGSHPKGLSIPLSRFLEFNTLIVQTLKLTYQGEIKADPLNKNLYGIQTLNGCQLSFHTDFEGIITKGLNQTKPILNWKEDDWT